VCGVLNPLKIEATFSSYLIVPYNTHHKWASDIQALKDVILDMFCMYSFQIGISVTVKDV
jgi:hypothetical protein